MVEYGEGAVNLPQIREGGSRNFKPRNTPASKVSTEQRLRDASLKFYVTQLHKVKEPFRSPLLS